MKTELANKERRVLRLIARVDMSNAPPKQWSVIRLLKVQPLAQNIRFEGRCDSCCKSDVYLSYRLPHIEPPSRKAGLESCSYFCSSCGFSIAGLRNVKAERKP